MFEHYEKNNTKIKKFLYLGRDAVLPGTHHRKNLKYNSMDTIVPEKLTGPELVKKFPAFYGTPRLRSSLFWDVTRSRLLVIGVSEQPTRPEAHLRPLWFTQSAIQLIKREFSPGIKWLE